MATKMAKPKARKRRETFGAVEKRDSGRYRASYVGPDGERHRAPQTFDTMTDARGWLATERAAIVAGSWQGRQVAEQQRRAAAMTVGEYAARWIAERTGPNGSPLRERTRVEYERLLRTTVAPLADLPLDHLTSARIRSWHREILDRGRVTTAARAYGLLRSICRTAVEDGILAANPVSIRGAQNGSTGRKVEPPTRAELAVIVERIPGRYRCLVLVAAWGGLRFGELTELRRRDVRRFDLDGVPVYAVRVERAVAHVPGKTEPVVGAPKSAAGVRTVTLPPTVTDDLDRHLREHVARGADALLFPAQGGGHLKQSSLAKVWHPARAAAGRSDMPWHALRHFQGVQFALTGATTAEIMERLGHSTFVAAMRYQHTSGRDAQLAARLDAMAVA